MKLRKAETVPKGIFKMRAVAMLFLFVNVVIGLTDAVLLGAAVLSDYAKSHDE